MLRADTRPLGGVDERALGRANVFKAPLLLVRLLRRLHLAVLLKGEGVSRPSVGVNIHVVSAGDGLVAHLAVGVLDCSGNLLVRCPDVFNLDFVLIHSTIVVSELDRTLLGRECVRNGIEEIEIRIANAAPETETAWDVVLDREPGGGFIEGRHDVYAPGNREEGVVRSEGVAGLTVVDGVRMRVGLGVRVCVIRGDGEYR